MGTSNMAEPIPQTQFMEYADILPFELQIPPPGGGVQTSTIKGGG